MPILNHAAVSDKISSIYTSLYPKVLKNQKLQIFNMAHWILQLTLSTWTLANSNFISLQSVGYQGSNVVFLYSLPLQKLSNGLSLN